MPKSDVGFGAYHVQPPLIYKAAGGWADRAALRRNCSIDPSARERATSAACRSKPAADSGRFAVRVMISHTASEWRASMMRFAPETPPEPPSQFRAARSQTPVQPMMRLAALRPNPRSSFKAAPISAASSRWEMIGSVPRTLLPVLGNILRILSLMMTRQGIALRFAVPGEGYGHSMGPKRRR